MPHFKKSEIAHNFNQAANTYDDAAILQREIADQLLDRLDLIKLQPKTIVELGCGTGYCTEQLANRYPQAKIIAIDIAAKALRKINNQHVNCINADAEVLPVANDKADLVISSLLLHWCNDIELAYCEMYRILNTNGLLMFSAFGEQSLFELREAWAEIDDAQHVHDFLQLQQAGDALLKAQFSDPVVDKEDITVNFKDIYQLMRDLKNIGVHNIMPNRKRGLTGKGTIKALEAAYPKLNNGKVPASYEVIFGHAWKTNRNEVAIPISAIRRRLNNG